MSALERETAQANQLSAPLLLHTFPDYAGATNKLFVVGQETNWWGEDDLGGKKLLGHSADTVELLMQCYERFALGRRYDSPLWRFAPSLYRALNPDSSGKTGFLWSNLYKTDQRGKRPNQIAQASLRTCQPKHILRQEIAITKPDTVVFVTGHGLDWEIRNVFPDAKSVVLDGRFLARIEHPELPKNTFRTYHPSYLQRKSRLSSMVQQIAEAVR